MIQIQNQLSNLQLHHQYWLFKKKKDSKNNVGCEDLLHNRPNSRWIRNQHKLPLAFSTPNSFFSRSALPRSSSSPIVGWGIWPAEFRQPSADYEVRCGAKKSSAWMVSSLLMAVLVSHLEPHRTFSYFRCLISHDRPKMTNFNSLFRRRQSNRGLQNLRGRAVQQRWSDAPLRHNDSALGLLGVLQGARLEAPIGFYWDWLNWFNLYFKFICGIYSFKICFRNSIKKRKKEEKRKNYVEENRIKYNDSGVSLCFPLTSLAIQSTVTSDHSLRQLTQHVLLMSIKRFEIGSWNYAVP